MVETAIVINVFLVLMLGVFEFGRLAMVRQIVANAAREGARAASAAPATATTADITAVINQFVAPASLSNVAISVYKADANGNNVGAWTDADFGTGIGVQVAGDYAPMVPGFSTMRLQARSVMQSEDN